MSYYYNEKTDVFHSLRQDPDDIELSNEIFYEWKEKTITCEHKWNPDTKTFTYTPRGTSPEEHKNIIMLSAQSALTATDTYVVRDTFAYMPLTKKTSVTNYREYLQDILYNDDFDFSKIKELKTLQDF